MNQRVAFLYLNTGGGHIAPAKALASGLQSVYHDTDISFLLNGFSDRMKLNRYFFENGYSMTSNYFELGYVLFYRATEFPVSIRFGNYMVSIHGLNHLARFFREHEITKVVCLHEALIIVARQAIDRVDPAIPLVTILTDPFTAHALWFFEKRQDLVVFSEKLRREAIEKYGFDADRVHAFPFILNRAYERRYTAEEIASARARLGIPDGRKVLLIAGGGEGLKSADRIVSGFVKRNRPETLIVVCGKNRLLRRLVSMIVDRSGAKNVMVFGFVPFMPDLLNIADCVITKGGASTVMEVLAVGKPVIFSTFIRGQELGNVLYAVYGGAGWYIRKPDAILDRSEEVLENPAIGKKIRENIAKLGIRNGLDDVVSFIHGLGQK
jgi:UDP-N-acetylglucosamine:LPS N-acetylglucosamine transferase